MKRCTRCIIPDTVPGVSFDGEGLCNFCRTYEKPDTIGMDALKQLISGIAGKDSAYDCIVPLSGGRDSTYVLYVAKEMLKLRVLAVNYDQEFRTDQAVINMRTACDRLGIELLSIRSKRDIASKIVKHNMLCSDLTRVLGVCRACTYGYRSVVFSAAAKHKVPLILWGDSEQEKTKGLLLNAKRMLRRNKLNLSKICNPNFYKYELFFLLQRLEFPMPGKLVPTKSTKWKDKGAKEISVFDYIPWDRKVIKDTIMGKLGWEAPEGAVSTWRTDCKLGTVVNHCFVKTYGCTKHCFGFSNMINDGQMDRETALMEEEAMLAIVEREDEMRELLKNEIGFADNQVDKILGLRI